MIMHDALGSRAKNEALISGNQQALEDAEGSARGRQRRTGSSTLHRTGEYRSGSTTCTSVARIVSKGRWRRGGRRGARGVGVGRNGDVQRWGRRPRVAS